MCPLKNPRETHRVDPIIYPLLPRGQAVFRQGRSTVDQVTLLAQNIEDSFSAKKKAGAVFIDLTAAYDTVWHRSLICKLLQLLPDRHMVHMIMKMVGNGSFTPFHQIWPKEQVLMPQEQRLTGICPGAPTVQHLHL